MELQRRIERECGLVGLPSRTRGGLPVFRHEPTQQEFVLIPGGAYLMGMTAAELVAALQELDHDPRIAFWQASHRRTYAAANPVHSVAIQSFLCGRSPVLGRTVIASGVEAIWSAAELDDLDEDELPEPPGASFPAELEPAAVIDVLAEYAWELITEAQWEYVARCGGAESWAGGSSWREAAAQQARDPRCSEAFPHDNAWGIWGLALGEWVADEWHGNYTDAPCDGSAWRPAIGPPGAVRGGGVLHAPWQDRDEAISCHAATRQGSGSERGMFRARPVISLPWLRAQHAPLPVPRAVDYDAVVAEYERVQRPRWEALRREEEARRQREQERAHELAERKRSLRDGLLQGRIRSVGANGLYVVQLAAANGILRLPGLVPPLEVGDLVDVRVTGTGGVPELALVARR